MLSQIHRTFYEILFLSAFANFYFIFYWTASAYHGRMNTQKHGNPHKGGF